MERWGLAVDGAQLSFEEVFGTIGDVVLDIGFGGGEALIEVAETAPSRARHRRRCAHPWSRRRARSNRDVAGYAMFASSTVM